MTTTTVTATYLNPDETACSGRVVFQLVAATYHDGLDAIFPTVPITAVLDASGDITVELEPTSGVSADFDATDMTYQVRERINGADRSVYYVDIPTAPAVDLGTLATYDDPPILAREFVTPDLSALGYAQTEDIDDAITAALGFNVRNYGALGDGVTDDSAAFIACHAAAYAARATNAAAVNGAAGEKIAQGPFVIPPGNYLIESENALIPATEFERTRGLRYVGAGKYNTTITFTPSANKYLASNLDSFMWLSFEGITFASTVPTASFMLSDSDGAPQGTTFRDCVWIGDWKYGVNLTGSNTNSEMTFDNCDIIGDWTAFLYVDSADTADQFVNHNFHNVNVAMSTGHLVDISKGGNLNFWGGSLIHTGDGSASQILFALRGATHSSGVPRLLVSGARVEHRHALSQLIYCEWATGNIQFVNVDTSSQKAQAWGTTATTAEWDFTNWMGPVVVFDGCSLMGLHSYTYRSNSYNFGKRVKYRDCTIEDFATPDLFITNANPGPTTNVGGKVPVTFEGCRGSTTTNGERYPFDCVVNGEVSSGAVLRKRWVSMKISAGTLPYSGITTATLVLPLAATITRVRFWKGASGSASNTDWSYVLTDGDALEIARVQGGGVTQWLSGFDDDSGDLFLRCTTTNKRTLTLTSANITQTQAESFCLVEYLA